MKKIFTTLLLLYTVVVFSQADKIDSLQQLVTKSLSADEKIDLYLKLFVHKSKSDIDSSFFYLETARSLFNDKISDSVKHYFYKRYTEYFLRKNRYDSALIYVDKGLAIKNVNPAKILDMYTMKGTTHYYLGNYENALESHLHANRISDSLHLDAGRARVYNNIGITFMKLEDWKKAEDYMAKSYEICRNNNIKSGISYTSGNLGIIYKNQNKLDEAIAMYQISIKNSKALNDFIALNRNYLNVGALYEKKGDLDLALANYENAITSAEQTKNKYTLTLGYHNKAAILTKMAKYAAAEQYYTKAEVLAKEMKLQDILKEIYLGISNHYEQTGDYKKALESRKNYEKWKDSVLNARHLSSISELEIKYETEKKEKDILALSQQKLKNEAVLVSQQVIIKRLLYGFLVAVALVLLSFIIYKQYITNRKKQELIDVINATQAEERKRIAQDLHDSVGGSLALLKNKIQQVVSPATEAFNEIIATVTTTSDQVREISHNLMPGELVRFGLAPAIRTLLEQLNEDELNAQLYTSDENNRFENSLEIQLYRIIQEAIQNVLKHAKAKNLEIHLNRHKQYLNLLIEDDGQGMQVSEVSGIGIKNITQRVKILNGTFNIDSSYYKGTTLNIQIPL